MSPLSATSLRLARRGRLLLDSLSLSLAPGSLHALLGTNGAGKTTLMRVLSGEWMPDTGSVLLAGQPLSQLDARAQARQRAVLPQQDTLTFGFTVAELAGLGRLTARDQRPATTRRIVDAVLDATGTTDLASRRYPELSGGERRRAQLARALAQVWDHPGAVLLLDEPTHSLDLAHQHAVMALLRRLAGQGFAVLASLHELNLAAAYAHQASLLREGRLLATGTTEEVLQVPALKATFGERLQFTAVGSGAARLWLTHPETG